MSRILVPVAVLLASTACDYSGDFLFAGAVEGYPGVVHLGEIVPADIFSQADIDANRQVLQIGPSGTPELGGVTFTFTGTGGNICIFVDPETAYWSQSVSRISPLVDFSYPDEFRDDGDLDLYGGLAVFYNGTPGESMGDFTIRYEDALGNVVPVDANECRVTTTLDHGGRGRPEYCTINATIPGVTYLIKMETWITPMDDDVLSYGLIVANGKCQDNLIAVSDASSSDPECVILEESIDLATGNPRDTKAFELAFCASAGSGSGETLDQYCIREAEENDCDEVVCFCGDPDETPDPGAF